MMIMHLFLCLRGTFIATLVFCIFEDQECLPKNKNGTQGRHEAFFAPWIPFRVSSKYPNPKS